MHWRRFRCPALGGLSVSVSSTSLLWSLCLNRRIKAKNPAASLGSRQAARAAGRPGGRPAARPNSRWCPLRVWARGRLPGPHAAVEAAQCLAHDSLRCSCSLCRDGGHRDGQPPKSWASESSPVQSYARLSVFQGTPSSSLHLGWSKKTCKETF